MDIRIDYGFDIFTTLNYTTEHRLNCGACLQIIFPVADDELDKEKIKSAIDKMMADLTEASYIAKNKTVGEFFEFWAKRRRVFPAPPNKLL